MMPTMTAAGDALVPDGAGGVGRVVAVLVDPLGVACPG